MLFILFGIVYFVLLDRFVSEEIIYFFAASVFVTISGIWGNIAKMVLLRIPSGKNSYKIINIILIILGITGIVYSIIDYIII